MKFLKNLFSALIVIVYLSGVFAFANNNNEFLSHNAFDKIIIKEEELQLEQIPFSKNNYMMLPLRNICEKLGYVVSWDEEIHQVKVTTPDADVLFNIGNTTIEIISNNNSDISNYTGFKKIRFAPKIVNDRTYVIPAAIQVGLLDDVVINYAGDFIITPRHKKYHDNVSILKKTFYKENSDGLVTGVADIVVPILYNPDNSEGLSAINNSSKEFFDYFSYDSLKNDLTENEFYPLEFVKTIYIDYNIVADMNNIISFEYPTFYADSYEIELTAGKMFYKSTGEKITSSEMFNTNDSSIFDMLMNAYNNNDPNLLDAIRNLKYIIKYFNETVDIENISDVYVITTLANFLNPNIHENIVSSWISTENDDTLLNFMYFGFTSYRCVSINLKNALDYLNKDFVLNTSFF